MRMPKHRKSKTGARTRALVGEASRLKSLDTPPMQLSGAEEEPGEEEPREQQDGGTVDSVLSVARGARCPHSARASRLACVHGQCPLSQRCFRCCTCAVSGEIEDGVWANGVYATRSCRTGRRDRPRHPTRTGQEVSHRSLDAAARPALNDLLALTVPQDPGAIISVSAVPDQTTGRGYQDRSACWQCSFCRGELRAWVRSEGTTRTGGNEIKGGTSPNRPCACCGSAMEPNRATGPSAAIEYCHRCGREPLCACCSNFEFGWPPAIDMRWARLTFTAANAFPRTVAGVERVRLVTCCHCMGELGQEHEDPEQPLPITHGRPEGWRLCSQCVITMIRHGNGMRTWRHSCTRGGSQHAQTALVN